MDGRFHFGFCIRLAGPSQCGKTQTLLKLLGNKKSFYPCPPKRVVWVSGSGVVDTNLENTIKAMYPVNQFFYAIPEEITPLVQEYDFWVFDDMASELKSNTEFTNFFTKIAHHKNCIMAYLSQNAYEKGADATTRTRNCLYQIYFENKADCRWIRTLGDQLLGNVPQFKAIFKSATREPFACLLCDNRTTTSFQEQFISNPFDSTRENPTGYLVPHK